jgi:hypothetical protein
MKNLQTIAFFSNCRCMFCPGSTTRAQKDSRRDRPSICGDPATSRRVHRARDIKSTMPTECISDVPHGHVSSGQAHIEEGATKRADQKICIPKKNDLVFRHNNGKPMLDVRDAWLRAVGSAVKDGILDDADGRPHDLRRSAITRWTSLGIPRDIVMQCSGHRRGSVHDGYLNFSDQQLVAAFESAGLLLAPKVKPTKAKAV